MSTTGNKRGRPRLQRDWTQNFKLSAQISFNKHPAAHTFLYVNMENEQLSDIVAKALEDYLEVHAPDYFDSEYQVKVVQEARERETAKLMQSIRSEKVEVPRPIIRHEVPTSLATSEVLEPKVESVSTSTPVSSRGLFAQVDANPPEVSSEGPSEQEEALANKLIG